jgi:hypothetical protein
LREFMAHLVSCGALVRMREPASSALEITGFAE